jgi:hypothetical protein
MRAQVVGRRRVWRTIVFCLTLGCIYAAWLFCAAPFITVVETRTYDAHVGACGSIASLLLNPARQSQTSMHQHIIA